MTIAELKGKLEDKEFKLKEQIKNSEKEKNLILFTLNLLTSEETKKIGMVVAQLIVAEEEEVLSLFEELQKFEISHNELLRELTPEILELYGKKMAHSQNNQLPKTPLPNTSFSISDDETKRELKELTQKLENQNQLINQLKSAVVILALIALASIVSTLFSLIKKWYGGEKRKKVSILDKKRELSLHN